MSFIHRISSSLCLAAVLCFSGCGGGEPTGDVLPVVEAAGVLTHQGKPLEHYQVIVMPEGDRPAMGVTDADGKFTLGTNEAGDGALPGTHPVAVSYVGPPSNNPEEGITVFTKPPPPKEKIDPKYGDPATSGVTVVIPESGTTDLKIELN